MAEALGQAVLTLSVDDRQYKAGLDQSKRLADQTGDQINRSLQVKGPGGGLFGDVGAELGALKGGLAAGGLAAAGVAVAVGAIGVAAVQAAGDAQKLTAAFTGLTGSASAAAALRQELFTLSKATPFRNEELLGAAQRFLAVGVEADKLGGTINRIGALAAQSGQSLDRVGLIYAQVFAKGRLQGEENLQFLEAGIDLNRELAQVTGLSGQALQDAMSKGKISVNDVNQAIVLATGSMSALTGAGQSVSVQFANIGDNLEQVFLGFAQAISPALEAAFGVINQAFDRLFPSLESIGEFFAPLTKEAERFAELLAQNPRIVEALALAFESLLSTGITPMIEGIASINEGLENRPDELIQGIVELELRLRQAALTATGLIKIITAPARLGGVLSGEAQAQVGSGLRDIQKALAAKPIEVPVNIQAKVETTAPVAGDLTMKPESKQAEAEYWAKSIAAANELKGIQEDIAIQRQRGSLTGIGIGALQAVKQLEDAKRAEQDAQAALRATPGDAKLLSASQVAAANVELAAAKTKADLEDAFKSAQNAVRNISRSIEDSVTALNSARGSAGGINRYIDPQQAQERQSSANVQLFREASRLAEQLGVRANFSGGLTERNSQLNDFINAARQELRGTEDLRINYDNLAKANNDLAAVSASLVNVNTQLAEATANLAAKDWNVYVNVPTAGDLPRGQEVYQ